MSDVYGYLSRVGRGAVEEVEDMDLDRVRAMLEKLASSRFVAPLTTEQRDLWERLARREQDLLGREL